MKKLLIISSLLFLSISSTYACKLTHDLWKEIPKEILTSCYEKTWNINPEIKTFDPWNWEKCIDWNTFKINSPEKIDTFISNNEIIPHKLFKNAWENIDYKINLTWDKRFLQDNSLITSLIYDTSVDNEIIINLEEFKNSWSFDFNFKYEAQNFKPNFNISTDWVKYFSVDLKNISDYDLKYLKIKFYTTVKHITNEKIKIAELNFKTKNYQYLIKTLWKITTYSNNMCKNNYLNLSNNTWEFNLDKDTKTLELELKNNPDYNIYKQKDKDNDWVEDSEDNCIDIYNPMQKDKTWNGKWDLCSDDDKDWIIWNKDNCVQIYNPDQKDINRNKVWDICEFDKDNDWVFDALDNCINTPNPNQLDKDKDGIWDLCDNCKSYNPRQLDINNNSIWDVCEKQEEYLKENDDDNDSIINYKDNCKEIYNKDQLDSDKDWVWDMCDNCSNIQNKNQLDFNDNWIWDICEDSDNDWIEWIVDNCINISNKDQLDSDNDWVWDLCEDDDRDNIVFQNDNCPYVYNVDQIDIDKDGIWDKCDETDNRYIESNSNFFISLIIFITLAFFFWTYLMVRKLK